TTLHLPSCDSITQMPWGGAVAERSFNPEINTILKCA
ncbi:MAG: hypothetical protein ACI8PG_005042, partial [Planctomycetota bacterium]